MTNRGASAIRVFIADDDPGFREVVRLLIDGMPDLTLVGEAACAEDAIDAVAMLQPDLVLMDVRMPSMGGIEAARTLLGRQADLAVVLMSAHELPAPSGVSNSGPRVMFVLKEHLCRRALLDLWYGRKTRSGPNWVAVRLA